MRGPEELASAGPPEQFFEATAFSKLETVEEGHFWFEERNRLLAWCVQRYFPQITALGEVGCGTGFVLRHLQNRFPSVRATAAEFFAEAIQIARQRCPRAQFVRADARRLPFLDKFDVIGAFDVIEHIEEDEIVLEQLYQSLKPQGGLILTVPQHMFLWSPNDEIAHHKRRYARPELSAKVRRAGFRVIRCTSFVTTLLPFMLASRLISRKQNQGEGSIREFRLPSSVNWFFRASLALERLFIRSGVSLPCGGSLLLVAVKTSCAREGVNHSN